MSKSFKDKMTSGVVVLIVGVTLLVFTFLSAFLFLNENVQILASQDLTQTFGASISPLITTCIRIMYLGVMGWMGSLITIRAVTLINANKNAILNQQKIQGLQLTKNKAMSQPEFMVTPLEEIEQQQPQRK
jgi:hypothetical protein